MKKTSQKFKVLQHLMKGYTITQLEALMLFDNLRLAPIILELRREGYDIVTVMLESDNKQKQYAQYRLIQEV